MNFYVRRSAAFRLGAATQRARSARDLAAGLGNQHGHYMKPPGGGKKRKHPPERGTAAEWAEGGNAVRVGRSWRRASNFRSVRNFRVALRATWIENT